MRIGTIIQARMGSTRLPGKVLLPLCGKPLLTHVVDRVRRASLVGTVVIATSQLRRDQPIVELAKELGVEHFCGHEKDVLERFAQATRRFDLNTVIRVTADNPLVAPDLIDEMVESHLKAHADYTNNSRVKQTYPLGLDLEVIADEALLTAHEVASEPYQREHVTPYIYENPIAFQILTLEAEGHLRKPNYRLTVDTENDYRLMSQIYDELYYPHQYIPTQAAIELIGHDSRFSPLRRRSASVDS